MKKTLLAIIALSLVLFSCEKSSTDEDAKALLLKASENLSTAESYSISGNLDFSMKDSTTDISGNGEISCNYIANPMTLEMNVSANANVAGTSMTVPVAIYMVTEDDGIMMYVNASEYWVKSLVVPTDQISDFTNQVNLSDADFIENGVAVTYGGLSKVNSKKYYTSIITFTENTFPYLLEKMKEMGMDKMDSFSQIQEEELSMINSIINGLTYKTYIDQETETIYGYEMELGSQISKMLLSVMESQGASQEDIDEMKKSKIEGKFLFVIDGINDVEAITLPEDAKNAINATDAISAQ